MLTPITKKRKFMIYLQESTIEQIKAIANGRSVAEVIRMAIDEFLERHKADG